MGGLSWEELEEMSRQEAVSTPDLWPIGDWAYRTYSMPEWAQVPEGPRNKPEEPVVVEPEIDPEPEVTNIKPRVYQPLIQAVQYDGTEERAWQLIRWVSSDAYLDEDGRLIMRPTDDEAVSVGVGQWIVKGLSFMWEYKIVDDLLFQMWKKDHGL